MAISISVCVSSSPCTTKAIWLISFT
jgi:hypothetical protein